MALRVEFMLHHQIFRDFLCKIGSFAIAFVRALLAWRFITVVAVSLIN